MSRENPIRLFGVATLDFERFLKVLYPPQIGMDGVSTSEEWASVLNIADRFAFTSVRELAIRKLLAVASPVEKVVLGHRFAERRLLIPGYMALVSRYSALSLDEAVCLGMADVVLISQAREAIRDGDYTYSGDVPVESLFAGRLPPPSAPE
ncbi:hypothetical protein SCHPADRAFT_902685 [Schizopora paradoxa]|uniref:BTB domain-containing protein n=1 Tax=Schizopora paradoxa TaxID=27342 RepID=A0A0H2RTF9_9AGAM|nr:hypothetical protein SCHPADRAFT_902685 [Schizopora paradoxa]